MALELRPNCEWCDRDLPPEDTSARICTYECTFCAGCVEAHLRNVCPNCGGGFVPRPVRPATARRPGISRVHQPPSPRRVHLTYDKEEAARFAAAVHAIDPAAR